MTTSLSHSDTSAPEPSLSRVSDQLEQLLKKNRCTLTMGGEPTYLPLKPEGEEWNQAALGPTKLSYARQLAGNLIRSHFPGSVLMQTYGKTYPGEPLPRWNIVLEIPASPKRPLWKHPDLLLTDGKPERPLTPRRVAHLARRIAENFGFTNRLRKFSDPSGSTSAFALPLRFESGKWQSCGWPQTNAFLQLVKGDSSAGLRLPLDSLPANTPRTALTIQAREEGVEIFLPPLQENCFHQLLARIESVATASNIPHASIILCGYLPEDGRAENRILMASDPGVLEVNLPPTGNWKSYHRIATTIDQAAAEVGLCTHKFHFNGNVQGTGGGAHFAFGGSDADHSPFLTRPHLLSSMIRYWHNHPCLSYLFTGPFIGPGSQAPRADESNPMLVGELELALGHIEARLAGKKKLSSPDFDQLYLPLKHFFVDAAGNTHRSEICLDKLWNFAAPNGKLGIVEFRAFESCPHASQLCLHGLLLRAILTRCLDSPYREPLRRWGNTLHDRYLLRPFIEQDLKAVLRDLNRAGVSLPARLFEPTLSQRFPVVGHLSTGGKGEPILVYEAMETTPLLSEVPTGSVTSRPVDIANARLGFSGPAELAQTGFLRVAGVPIGLKVKNGKAVRGIRYRSFPATLSLHPFLPASEPLRIEWIDGRTRKAVSAARRYYWNPDGKDYPDRPESFTEAEQRRRERWKPVAPGKSKSPLPGHSNPEWTFDLRQQFI